MDAQAIATVTTAVLALTEITKRSTRLANWATLLAFLYSCLGVGLWLISQPAFPPARTDTWSIAIGIVTVFGAATGTYHLARRVTKANGSAFTTTHRREVRVREPGPPPDPPIRHGPLGEPVQAPPTRRLHRRVATPALAETEG